MNAHLHRIWLRREDLRRAFPDLDGADGPGLVEWAHLYGRREIPIPDHLLPPRPSHVPEQGPRAPARALQEVSSGVNVAGYLHGELGIGEASRLLIAALDAAGILALPMNMGGPYEFHGEHPYLSHDQWPPPFPTTIVCANPDGLWQLARQVGTEALTERHTIGMWWWEVQGAHPPEWGVPAGLVDEVWAGSRFVAEALVPLAPGPVRTVTLPVSVAPVRRPDRRALGLPEDFMFLFTFDYNSVLARKNPLAIVEAFTSAFRPGGGACLVLKTINGERHPVWRAAVEAATVDHPNIHVIDGCLDTAGKDALTACCDCYVSLHRSEGFGLPIAEAMHLGKPAIATAYGGNLEFMNEGNSFLVPWRPARVGESAGPYPAEGKWAAPDVEYAAATMRQVFDDPALARERGIRGAREIRQTHSLEAAARSVAELLKPVLASAAKTSVTVSAPTERMEKVSSWLDLGAEAMQRPSAGLRGLARRTALRIMRPLSAYQRTLDRELLAALAEVERRSLERHATVLAWLRRTGDESSGDGIDGPTPLRSNGDPLA